MKKLTKKQLKEWRVFAEGELAKVAAKVEQDPIFGNIYTINTKSCGPYKCHLDNSETAGWRGLHWFFGRFESSEQNSKFQGSKQWNHKFNLYFPGDDIDVAETHFHSFIYRLIN